MDIRHTATTCPYCGCGCGLTLETAEGRIQRSVPTPDSPVNRGKLCVKGWNVHEFIQHPDRLKTPLLRTEQGWKSCSRLVWHKDKNGLHKRSFAETCVSVEAPFYFIGKCVL